MKLVQKDRAKHFLKNWMIVDFILLGAVPNLKKKILINSVKFWFGFVNFGKN